MSILNQLSDILSITCLFVLFTMIKVYVHRVACLIVFNIHLWIPEKQANAKRTFVYFLNRDSDDVKAPSSYWLLNKNNGSRTLALGPTHHPFSQSQSEVGVGSDVTVTPAREADDLLSTYHLEG